MTAWDWIQGFASLALLLAAAIGIPVLVERRRDAAPFFSRRVLRRQEPIEQADAMPLHDEINRRLDERPGAPTTADAKALVEEARKRRGMRKR